MSNPLTEKQKEALKQRDFLLDWFDRASKERETQRHHQKTQWATTAQLNSATSFLGICQLGLIILFATVGGSQVLPPDAPGTGTQGYNMFIGVEIMM